MSTKLLIDLPLAVEELEAHWIKQALEVTEGNRSQAAPLIGLNRTTMLEKMRRLGMKLNPPPAHVTKKTQGH